jgi:hypothetical protein
VTDIDSIRADLSSTFYTDTATRVRDTLVNDGEGGTTVSGTTSATFKCQVIFDVLPRADVEGERQSERIEWEIEFPWGSDVVRGDHVTVNAHTYKVISTNSGETCSFELVARCERVE